MSRTMQRKNDEAGMLYLAAAGLVIASGAFVWYMEHGVIAYRCLKWVWYQLGLVDLPFMPASIGAWRAEAATLAANPTEVSLSQLLTALNRAGYFFVWIPVCLSLWGIHAALTHKANKTRRRITVQILPWIMSAHSPAVIPSLYYGDPATLLLNVDPPEHRSALAPEEWVSKHGLLVGGALDRRRCMELLTADLGHPITSLDALSPHEKALFAVFGLRLFQPPIDGDQAQALLDDLNRSCHKHTFNGKRGYPNLELTCHAFDSVSRHPSVPDWLARHSYPRTLLHSMHKAALIYGKLPSSHFRWLKGMDRGLWYALNTTGRKKPFIESVAVFTQASWESFARDSGYVLTKPCLDGAIDGLENYLVQIGLLPTPMKEKS